MTKSYWQIGCNDAKAGKPAAKLHAGLLAQAGYDNGYYWGQHGQAKPEPEFFTEDSGHGFHLQPDPPLKNPYMEAIENIEGILTRLHTFATEFPKELDSSALEEYASNLLGVRDRLHDFRQQELALGGA